jgi:glycosyltransferase involved in cell wall biosynthesis
VGNDELHAGVAATGIVLVHEERQLSMSKRIRVLQLGSPIGLYGAERWILALGKHLRHSRIEPVVGVIKDSPGGAPALCTEAARLGLTTHVFESYGRLSRTAIGQLRHFMHDRGIDILHTHGYKTDVIGFLAVRGTNRKIVSTPHGWSANAGIKVQIYEALDRLVFRFFDAVVPLSSDLYEGLLRLPGLKRKLHLIRNGVDLSEIDAVSQGSPELGAWKSQGGVIIGYIGQLIPRKGLDTLLRAFSDLGIPRKRLCIVGEGPQRPELERLAGQIGVKDQVHFFGFREDRIALMKCFDVFVLPSRLEGIPRCVLEAMAARVPVVASDIPGCRVLVEDEVTGMLFPVDDHIGLATKLRLVLGNDGLRDSMANAGYALVRREYSAEKMAEKYAELYAELAGGKRSGETSSAQGLGG